MKRPPGVPMSQWPSPHGYVLPARPPEEVTVTIDGREVKAKAGDLLIRVAQDHGTYIPRFCWHERLMPVGMCRMCLVEVEGMRGFQISCATAVTDGMVVHTQTPAVKDVQEGILEFLLINHPLDCPICDRGGECPLQDQTLAFGPGESRLIEEKRHWEKPTPLSDLIYLDRERCIQCGRCTRFADEIAGEPMIAFGERGWRTEVVAFPDQPYTSNFSCNVVQLCPVGALTARPYRFVARPWDLGSTETSCTMCAVQCRGSLESTSNHLVRLLGVDSEPVNHGWLCDKGRFYYEAVHSDDRVRTPMIRREGELVECSWPEALAAAAEGLAHARDTHGASSVAVLGGARGTNEDAYAWARLAKGVLGTDNVDAQLGDGLDPEAILGLPGATIADLDRARAIVLLAPDLREELPVLYLRARRAADELEVPLVDLAPVANCLTRYATAVARSLPGGEGHVGAAVARVLGGEAPDDDRLQPLADALAGRTGPVVVVLGRTNLADSGAGVLGAAEALAGVADTSFLMAIRRGNVRGALDLGLAPRFLPGRVALDAGRAWFTERWGAVPASSGLDAVGILDAAADGTVQALVLLGADPVGDFPDRERARAALASAPFVVAVDAFLTDSNHRADVFLPAELWGEKDGSVTNIEGRVQRVAARISADGVPMPDWRVAAELARYLGHAWDWRSAEDVQDEIAATCPAHAEVDARLLRRARDGVVLPLADHRDSVVLEPLRVPITHYSWEPLHPTPAEPSEPDALAADTAEGASDRPRDEDAESTLEDASTAVSPIAPVPALYRRVAPSGRTPTSTRDAYSLRLVSGRTLYDGGIAVSASPSLAGLVRPPRLRCHPQDRDRLGVADGDEVRITSSRTTANATVHGDDGVVAGTCTLAFNVATDGIDAAELIDARAPVTDLRVETVR